MPGPQSALGRPRRRPSRLIGPAGTPSFAFDEPSGTGTRTTSGSPRTLIATGPRVAAIAEFTALNADGIVLATSGPGTVVSPLD